MSNLKSTDVSVFLGDLAGGVFADQLAATLSDVADCVAKTGKKGQVKITLDISTLGEKGSRSVEVKHKLDFTAPEDFGSRKEDYVRKTPMYVNLNGTITLFNEDVGHLFEPTAPTTGKQAQTGSKSVIAMN